VPAAGGADQATATSVRGTLQRVHQRRVREELDDDGIVPPKRHEDVVGARTAARTAGADYAVHELLRACDAGEIQCAAQDGDAIVREIPSPRARAVPATTDT